MRTLVLSDSGGVTGYAGIATAGVGLCGHHVFERAGAHDRNYPGTHGSSSDVSAPGPRLLFFATSIRGFTLADVPAAANCARGFSIANCRLKNRVTKLEVCPPDESPADPAIIVDGVE